MPYQTWINGTHTSGTTTKIIEVRNQATEEINAFIGSLATGQRIVQQVALQVKKSHLEPGEEGSKKPWWYPYGKK